MIETLAPSTARATPFERRSIGSRYFGLLCVLDAGVLFGAAFLSQWLRFGDEKHVFALGGGLVNYTVFSIVLSAVWILLILAITIGSSRRHAHEPLQPFADVMTATLFLVAGYAVFATATQTEVSRGYLFIAVPAGTLGLLITRYIALRRPQKAVPTMLIGTEDELRGIHERLDRGNEPVRVREEIVLHADRVSAQGETILADDTVLSEGDLRKRVMAANVDAVVIATRSVHEGDTFLETINWSLYGSPVEVIVMPQLGRVPLSRLSVVPYGDSVTGVIRATRYQGAPFLIKRLVDILLSGLALVVLSPVLLVVSIMVRVTSSGPVIFRQERVGRHGKTFTILKFRTMISNAEEMLEELAASNESDGPLFKMRDDPRVTSIGGFLRKWSLDELPQLINVLRGDMSLVGPRPALPTEVEQYDVAAKRRLLAVPGITGPWQISGRSDLTWQQGLSIDLFYIDNWSLALDCRIIALTFVVVLARKGAY
ncbi:sugar transferase [Mycetocola tolaasinivorans]|nr:sugar transferase [Mycetocola tolaasinivorans]